MGTKGSREYLDVCNSFACSRSRTSVCIGFVVGPSTITGSEFMWVDKKDFSLRKTIVPN